jgi:hypothetical protein
VQVVDLPERGTRGRGIETREERTTRGSGTEKDEEDEEFPKTLVVLVLNLFD